MKQQQNLLIQKAMYFGTFMGIYWILKFTLLPLGFNNTWLHFLFLGLTIYVPFLSYKLTRIYRDRFCGGSIEFSHAWLFSCCMFVFASLLTAVAHYIYFQFLDHGFIIGRIEETMRLFKDTLPADQKESLQDLDTSIALVKSLTPIELTIQFMGNNLFYGSLFSLIVAMIVKKKKQIKI